MIAEQVKQSIVIGIAKTTKEKEAIYKLRYQIYYQEMRKEIQADHDRQMIVDELDNNGYLFFAKIGSQVVGTVRLNIGVAEDFPSSIREYFLMHQFRSCSLKRPLLSYSSRLMVTSQYRNSWVTYQMLAEMYRFAIEQEVAFNFCYCAPELVELYKRFGYRTYIKSRDYFDKKIYTAMVLVADDIQYMRGVRSPLYRLASKLGKTHVQQTVDWFEKKFPLVKQQKQSPC